MTKEQGRPADSNHAAQELQSFVRRVESVEDEINVLNQDKSAIYKEAKSAGFNTKTLRKVIAARRMDATEREEQDAEFDLYWNAVHGIDPDLVRAHVENIEQFDAETGEITEPQVAPQPVQTVAPDAPVTSPVESEAVEISTSIHEGEAQKVERWSPKPEAAGSIPATLANDAGSRADRILKIRPLCQHPTHCMSSGGKTHCFTCRKVAAETQGAA